MRRRARAMNPDLLNSLPVLNDADTTEKPSRREAKQHQHMDRGWAWVVLGSAFVIHVILFGLISGIGMFYSEFLDEFKRGPVATSWLIATNSALTTVAGPIGSILANKFGFRPVLIAGSTIVSLGFVISFFATNFWTLLFSFGVMLGTGWGITYAPSFGILALYFDKRKTFATALCTVGCGVGAIVVPPLQGLLIDYMAWRGTCLIFGGIALNMIPCAMFYLDKHTAPKALPPSLLQSADVSLFRKASFYFLILHFFLIGAFGIFNIVGLRFAVEYRGVAQQDAPLLLSLQGVSNVFGRLSTVGFGLSPLASSQSITFALYHLTTVVFGICVAAYSLAQNFSGLLVVSAFLGYFHGARAAFLPSIVIEIFSARRFSTTWSYALCVLGVGSLLFPPLGEWIAVRTGRSEAPLFLSGSCVLVSCSCTLALQVYEHFRRKTKRKSSTKLRK